MPSRSRARCLAASCVGESSLLRDLRLLLYQRNSVKSAAMKSASVGKFVWSSKPLISFPSENSSFQGRYHVLGGRLAPLDHIGPDQLRIDELLEAARATLRNHSCAERGCGRATTNYRTRKCSRHWAHRSLASPMIPAGGGLEQADPLTLQPALAGRNPLKVWPAAARKPMLLA